MDTSRHAGRVAVVTGAADGIGRATAIRLATEGAAVVACDVDGEGLNSTAKQITDAGGQVTALQGDITAQAHIDAVFAEAQRLGSLTLVANVAGIADYFQPVGEVDDELWNRVIDINLTGVMRCMRAAVKIMEPNGAGSIVNIASVAGLGGGGGGAAYTAAKHGVVGLTKSFAFLYGERGVRCNAICPGGVDTGIRFKAGFAKIDWVGERMGKSFNLSNRLAAPEEIAGLISFLGCDESVNLNGAVIASDSGWTAV